MPLNEEMIPAPLGGKMWVANIIAFPYPELALNKDIDPSPGEGIALTPKLVETKKAVCLWIIPCRATIRFYEV